MTWMRRAAAFIAEKCWGETDGRRLRLFEIAFTLQYMAWMGMLYLHPTEWLGVDGFHVSLADQNKGYWEPWPRLPDWGVVVFGFLLYGGAALVLTGWWRRLGLWLCFSCALYVQFADTPSAFSVSRLNIIVFAILATAPPPYLDSANRWRQSVGVIRLLQTVLVTMYFFAGISKLAFGNWNSHEDVILSHMLGFYRTDFAAWLVRVMPSWYWGLQKYLALSFELGAPLLFTIRKLRPLGIILGLGFHLTIATCFWTIWPFALHMVTYYVLFLPAKHVAFITERSLLLKKAFLGQTA